MPEEGLVTEGQTDGRPSWVWVRNPKNKSSCPELKLENDSTDFDEIFVCA